MQKQLENLIKKCQFAIDENKITTKLINEFFEGDPTPNKNMVKFMCYFYIRTHYVFVVNIFDRYWELGKLKDKYNFKLEPLDKIVKDYSVKEFKNYIEDIENEIEKKIQLKNQNKINSQEYKILDENSEWVAIEPLTFEASCKFGGDSDWCTTKTQAYFNTYSNKETKLVIFIHKPTEKYYSENPTKSKKRNPDYKLQVQIPRENLKIKNKVFIESKYFLNLFDKKSKKYPNFNEFLKEINISPDKLSNSYKIQTDLDEIIEFYNIHEEDYKLLFNIINPKLNKQTGLIDCNGVNWHNLRLIRLPRNIKLGAVNGDFVCSYNNLTSLEGCPKEINGSFNCSINKLTSLEGCPEKEKVDGNFYCHYNKLTSLEGCPKKVGGDFYCYDNKLTSLKSCPEEVGGDFYCYNNQLTSLEGCPEKVSGYFNCYNNELTSLEGCPEEVGGDFDCYNNQLTSLEGCPKEINGGFYCHHNYLTSLKGCPKEVGGYFSCYSNQLTSLEGCPEEVGGDFSCYSNTKQFTTGEVKKYCNVKGTVYIY